MKFRPVDPLNSFNKPQALEIKATFNAKGELNNETEEETTESEQDQKPVFNFSGTVNQLDKAIEYEKQEQSIGIIPKVSLGLQAKFPFIKVSIEQPQTVYLPKTSFSRSINTSTQSPID